MNEIFLIHTLDSAPEQARPTLNAVTQNYGFVPNILGVMAEAPNVLNAYLSLSKLFDAGTLDPIERQVVLLAVSRENGCSYCVAAHSAAARMTQVPDEVVEHLRADRPLTDERLEALRQFTKNVVSRRGWVPEVELTAFLNAGFTRGQVLEVILGVAMKTLSNSINHLVETPLDEAFQAFSAE